MDEVYHNKLEVIHQHIHYDIINIICYI